jgi:hypothetical protein
MSSQLQPWCCSNGISYVIPSFQKGVVNNLATLAGMLAALALALLWQQDWASWPFLQPSWRNGGITRNGALKS